MNCFSTIGGLLCWYETPKVVHIRSKRVGILSRLLQMCIISYIIGYVMVYKKGYQEFGKVESTVVSKLKGVVSTNFRDGIPDEYKRIWDVPDLVIPASENEAFFVTTNVVITPNQTRGRCGEDPTVEGAICNGKENPCHMGKKLFQGNGVMTGNCIPSQVNLSVNVCEIIAWCPVEDDKLPLGSDKALLEETSDFTVLIKNFIEFPTFGKAYRRRNILETSNKTYLQSCRYHQETDPFCPIFELNEIVTLAGENYSQLAIMGGVIVITIEWNCNLDWNFMEYCKPKYSFRRADDTDSKVAPGWNFRYAQYHEENRRTLFKAYGIRFIFDVQGEAGKFNIIPTLLNVGSGLALLGLTTFVCDLVILYCTKRKNFYKEVKYHLVDEDNNTEEETLVTGMPGRNYEALE